MGNIVAIGVAEAVADGEVELRKALGYHLTGNFFPALPGEYVEPLVEAVLIVAHRVEDDEDELITLPVGLNPVPRTAEYDEDAERWTISATELVEACRAWSFVEAVLEVSE